MKKLMSIIVSILFALSVSGLAIAQAPAAKTTDEPVKVEKKAAAKQTDAEKKAAAEKKNAELYAAIDVLSKDKDQLALQKKEAGARMPVAPVKYRNPGIFSMGAAFLVGIILSLLFPEKEAQEKFAGEKLREYIGIGAE